MSGTLIPLPSDFTENVNMLVSDLCNLYSVGKIKGLSRARAFPISRGMLSGKVREHLAMMVAPQIFYRTRSAPDTPYEQYRWDGEHVIRERVTPNATLSVAPYKEFVEQWTGAAFLVDNVNARAKNDFTRIWKEIHANRS